MIGLERILIMGCSGAGKSTFSKELGFILNLPIYHLDKIYWGEGWEPIESCKFEEEICKITLESRWIIDGNFRKTMDIRLRAADTIIFFDLPRYLCLFRVIKRRIRYHGKTRPDMNEGCKEKIDPEFLKWIWNFNKINRPEILAKINTLAQNKRIIVIKKNRDLIEFLNSSMRY